MEVYNRPGPRFRTAHYIVLIVMAWTALFHAINFKKGTNPWYKKKGKNPKGDRMKSRRAVSTVSFLVLKPPAFMAARINLSSISIFVRTAQTFVTCIDLNYIHIGGKQSGGGLFE
jgi:hypothetical protein